MSLSRSLKEPLSCFPLYKYKLSVCEINLRVFDQVFFIQLVFFKSIICHLYEKIIFVLRYLFLITILSYRILVNVHFFLNWRQNQHFEFR